MKRLLRFTFLIILFSLVLFYYSCELADNNENFKDNHIDTEDTPDDHEPEFIRATSDLIQNILPGDIILFADPTNGINLPTMIMPGDFGHCATLCKNPGIIPRFSP